LPHNAIIWNSIMKSIPMIFNQEMVSALTEGRKTATRRPMKLVTIDKGFGCNLNPNEVAGEVNNGNYENSIFKPGDLIWVRETFCIGRFDEVDAEHPADRELIIEQCAGDDNYIARQLAYEEGVTELEEVKWKPSIHMPRDASRLTLRVTAVRCERVQNIDKEQAEKEGVRPTGCTKGFWVKAYQMLWNSIYSNWDLNPWVWVIEFEVIHKNINQVIKGSSNV